MGVTICSNNSTKNLWMKLQVPFNTKIAGMGRENSKNKCCESSFSGLVQGTNCRNPCQKNLVGGIPTPLKNMSSSVGMMIPNIWKNKIHVPNHQPEMVELCRINSVNLPLNQSIESLENDASAILV